MLEYFREPLVSVKRQFTVSNITLELQPENSKEAG